MSDLLEYKTYYGTIEYCKNNKNLQGRIIGINMVICYEGKSIKEIEKNFQKAIDNYLDACKENSVEPEKAYRGNLRLRLPEKLHQALDIASNLKNKSINTLIIDSIEHYKPVKQILKQL